METSAGSATPRVGPGLFANVVTLCLASCGSVVGAAAGFVAVAAVADGFAGAAGMSNFEGGRSMFAVFFAAPFGGVVGFFGGVWLMLRLRGKRAVTDVLGYGVVSLLPTALIAAAVGGYLYFDNAPIYGDGSVYALEFEMRLPARAVVPSRVNDIRIELDTSKNVITGNLDPSAVRKDGERTVLVGEIELYFRASDRVLKLQMPDEPDRIFKLPLGASPRPFEAFTPWTHVDLIGDAADHPRPAGVSDDFDIRYRLPDPHKPAPHIAFEIRLPAGTRLPDDWHVLHIAQRRDDIDDDWGYFLHTDWKHLDGDRPVLTGDMAIRKPTKHPKITLKLLEGPLLVFDLDFPADARPTSDFGPWKPVTSLESYDTPPRPPRTDDRFELRYRIDPPR